MIDYFALALTHGLLVIALLRLARRSDLDEEGERPPAGAAAEQAGNRAAAETRSEARQRRRRRA